MVVLAVAFTPIAAAAAQSIPGPDAGCTAKRPSLATAQALGVNLFVNRLDNWVLGEETQKVNFESWARNLRLGWEWDENGFSTNMFSHPFHGAQYFNAGRSNCLTFWESIPLSFLGSWTWEYFGETNRPSLNDFFMTSIGGVALGEMTHRLAATIIDQEATGARRLGLEFLAMLVDPVGGVNRLWGGEWSKVHPNLPGRSPDVLHARFKLASRWVAQDTVGVCSFCPSLVMDVNYGDPLDQGYIAPFDVFEVKAQFSPNGGILNVLEAAGRLYQVDLNSSSSRWHHALGVTQRFAYSSYQPILSYGAQSIELGLLSRVPLPRQWDLHTRLSGNLLVMGGVDATNAGVGERDYDFGPGVGFGLEFDLWRHGHRYLSLRNRAEYLYTVSGVPADHLITISRFEVEVPIARRLGVGLATDVSTRTSSYDDDPDETLEFADLRLYLSWMLGR